MNGTRMNQLVAPTSFITSISRRRANMAMRMVLRMSSRRRPAAGRRRQEPHADEAVDRSPGSSDGLEGEHDLAHAGLASNCSPRAGPRRGPVTGHDPERRRQDVGVTVSTICGVSAGTGRLNSS
jgi:hypothetical protein